jgi:hypothetical protein
LIAAEAPSGRQQKGSLRPKTDPGGIMVEATYPIDEGTCSLIFPKGMSEKSAKRLKKWLELMIDDVAEVAGGAAAPAIPKTDE